MKVFTTLGEGGAVWVLIGILLLLKKETRKTGAVVLFSLLLCMITGNLILKNLVARPRPCWRNPEVEMLLAIPKDYSFPSGHTMSSFAAATGIFMWNKRLGLVAAAGALLIAVSRMYFYVHYPTDILAGLLLGIALGCLSAVVIGRLEECYVRRRERLKKI
ncbi:MAG: phosphatase PAP2 family protein [Lachnospiraceae bacterium]|nr:phosphatase PAP2 family protein [Lachnospiraceae bacterium]